MSATERAKGVAWTGGALRRAALAALGSPADPRARDALSRGWLDVAPGVARWQASRGPVDGLRVTLALDPAALEAVRAAPAVVDALNRALAAAVATRDGQSLFEFALQPLDDAGALVETPYRGRRPGP